MKDIMSTVPKATLDRVSSRLKLSSVVVAQAAAGQLTTDNSSVGNEREEGGEHDPGGSGGRNCGFKKLGGKSRVDPEMLCKSHDEFLEESKPVNTKKSTRAAISLYDSVSEEVGG